MSDAELASAMRRLKGQIATPPWMVQESRELESRGLMRFAEWPSGVWVVTERGSNFLFDMMEDEDE